MTALPFIVYGLMALAGVVALVWLILGGWHDDGGGYAFNCVCGTSVSAPNGSSLLAFMQEHADVCPGPRTRPT